ncbi:HAMP domain-containing sensor histidine kinase [Streptomyces sp. SP17BM10]|uniref:sensor histidine kinase n=1 Tax=Streptomyces sp. SP17BM10 TaxID=3002530 RepID=UPI002E76E6EB|nr:HAMP domain-containing sensor histidine kinase [Streptomyces sp. SP17BM10]MEE1787029.1 HAMP domain-containing sensor histidine kinase [Streptomyces sp. SP17BM10]
MRRRIALLFALVSALGLVGMAVFAAHADDTSWRDQVDSDLQARTSDVVTELHPDEDGVIAYPDPKDGGYDCPPVTLFTATGEHVSPVVSPHRPCLTVPAEAMRALAAEAAREANGAMGTATTPKGHQLRLSAEPVTGPTGTTDTVVVAAVDISGNLDSHERLTLFLAVACAILVAASAMIGRWLAGRAVRPALEALGQQEAFFADAAHDLRTPVTSMRLLAETGLRGEADSHEVLRRTLRQSTRMSELVEGLLTRARLMAGAVPLEREPLRLDQLVDAVVADTPAGAHRVAVRAEPVVVLADAGLLRRAVGNLLGNALAHGHAPGEPADIEITVTEDGTVAVDDAGPGIPPGRAESLFERFHSGAGSSGLGLSIAAWVAHAHGGSLTVVTGARGGARFLLSLPVRPQGRS